ncbi:MAG: hypothetical protein IJD95_02285 [Clostridia bacterium]|nr:hypothetical protein [Clostridia bacterium]
MNNESTKKVLIIKLSPVGSLDSSVMRALAVVKGLVEKGFEVDMLTLQTSATHIVNEKNYDFLEKVNLIYANPNKAYDSIVSSAKSGLKQKLIKILRKLYHTFSLYDYTGAIAKNIKIDLLPSREYEYVVAVSDPKTTHIAAKRLIEQGLTYNKLIEYWGDPLYGDITNKSIYPGFVYKIAEKNFLKIADKIVYTSPFTLEQEQRLYPKYRDKMIFTPTAYLEEKIYPENEGFFTVGYYGAYPSNVRNIIPLYDACAQMGNTVALNIVGNSDLTLEETENIKVYPRGDISSFEAKTDLFVCVLNKSGTQIPGKLYHYAAYNKPVLVIEDGDFAEQMHGFIESFNRYYTCRNRKEDIIEAITRIMTSNEKWTPYKEMSADCVVEKILE